jgi:hypothetical protein
LPTNFDAPEKPNMPSFPQLTPDARYWRIDWFGEMGYPGSVRRYSHPSIQVAISPAQDVSAEIPKANPWEMRNVWMPIGSLGSLRIGDVWKNGELFSSPVYCQNTFENIKIDAETVSPIKAGLSLDGSHLLPFEEHSGHRLHTNAYCLMVKMPGNLRLIIPAIEIIRFYFGTSSSLLHRLFTENFCEKRLWRDLLFNDETRHLHLKLADGMPTYAVHDIARIATNSHAKQSAASIRSHCVKATANGDPVYTYMGFPFVGNTTLTADGIWLSFAGKEHQTFLALHLNSCTHPLDFSSVTYDPCQRAPWKRKEKTKSITTRASEEKSPPAKMKTSILDDSDPGSTRKMRRFLMTDSLRFPDLRHKPVRIRELVVSEGKQTIIKKPDGSYELVAFGEPHGKHSTRLIELENKPAPEKADPEEKLPRFVQQGLKQSLTRSEVQKGFITNPFKLCGEQSAVIPLPGIVDEDGVMDTAVFFMEPDGSQRMRRSCFIGVFDGQREVRKMAILEGKYLQDPSLTQTVRDADVILLAKLIDEEKVLKSAAYNF